MKNVLGSRVFTQQDQHFFADASGDWNPIHIDPIYARRCLTGQAVAHGAHVAVWALDALARHLAVEGAVFHLKVQFNEPVFLDKVVDCYLAKVTAEEHVLELCSGSNMCFSITVAVLQEDATPQTVETSDAMLSKRLPAVRTMDEVATLAGKWAVDSNVNVLAAVYPHLHKFWGAPVAAMLAHCSRMVGMECPGLHSLFSELEFKLTDGQPSGPSGFAYKVTNLDKRFGLVRTRVEGFGFSGAVTAFIRPPPRQQASYVEVAAGANSKSFHGQRALVVGGSRGLGEIAAKLLAAGGADVCLTYHRGEQEAAHVVNEIRAHDGAATATALDVTLPFSPDWLAPQGWKPSHLYYLATPYIFAGRRGEFSQELLLQLMRCYVTGFAEMVAALADGGLQGVFYPSSVALNELPTDMAEYCAAKAAGETLCQVLQKRYPAVRFVYERLPRLATDQTVSLMPVKNADPLSIMRDIVLRMSTPKSH
jgi:acyl dehydratase/NADP-dependent 3-hydroxy acid dehydrogenase YdfG